MSVTIAESHQWCYDLTRRTAKNFFYGMKLTPEPKRSAMYVIYAFMRACDDLADEAPPEEYQRAIDDIETFRGQMQTVCAGGDLDGQLPQYAPLWPAFREVVQTYGITDEHLNAMLDGQKSDLVDCEYKTFDDLYQYCYRVASVVGLVCVQVWGSNGDPNVTKLAEQRGIALQLTNILRDLVEDAQRGRVYLPSDDLARYGYDPSHLARGEHAPGFDDLMADYITRAKGYYDATRDFEQYINPSCRAASLVIMRIYKAILDKIAADPRKVLQGRVRLSKPRKLAIAARAAILPT